MYMCMSEKNIGPIYKSTPPSQEKYSSSYTNNYYEYSEYTNEKQWSLDSPISSSLQSSKSNDIYLTHQIWDISQTK